MELDVREVTPDLWPALEELFSTEGPVGRCWCMYWRIGASYRKRPSAANRDDLRAVVEQGPPPGLLAFDGDLAVGWCQVTPREPLPALERTWRLRPVDDTPVWSISCFYIRKGYRRRGVTTALIEAAVAMAQRHGAVAVEAYPLDGSLSPSSTSTGYTTTFERAGFSTVVRHVPPRPIMRYQLRPAVTYETVDPRSPTAQEALGRYFAELDERFPAGFDAAAAADVSDLRSPHGAFVLVRAADVVVGCGGVQRIDATTGEIKRMWIDPTRRGLGVGRRLLARLEDVRTRPRLHRVVLDTNGALVEAIAMYRRAGYEAVERYNDNPYAQHWFAKHLGPA